MRLPSIGLLAATLQAASLVAGETWSQFIYTPYEQGVRHTSHFLWHTDFASYSVNINEDGCRKNPGVPFIDEVCMDLWHARGHFIVSGGQKRCMRVLEDLNRRIRFDCSKTGEGICLFARWEEVECKW